MTERDAATPNHDALSALVCAVGFFEGVLPFIARLLLDGTPVLALPARLDAPAWWIVSGAIVVAAFAALVAIDRDKARATR